MFTLAEKLAHARRELEWAERIIAVLMARPKPPIGTEFDTSDVSTEAIIRADERGRVLAAVEAAIFESPGLKLDLQTFRALVRR